MNRKPALVKGVEGVTRVACGSSHSVAWFSVDHTPQKLHDPILFPVVRDPLGETLLAKEQPGGQEIGGPIYAGLNETNDSRLIGDSIPQITGDRPSLSRVFLSLDSTQNRINALVHAIHALQILTAR